MQNMDAPPANRRSITTLWTLAKLVAAVAFWLTVIELCLFGAKLIGLFKPGAVSVSHLDVEHPVWTGGVIVFYAAFWLLAYSLASRRIRQGGAG